MTHGATDPRDPLNGTRYRTIRRLATGGMCDVFEAEVEAAQGEHLAAKVLRKQFAASAQLRDRMRVEAEVLSQLARHDPRHEPVDFLDSSDRRPAIVMRLLRGTTLQRRLDACGVPPVSLSLAWTAQALQALQPVHELGVVHRDVKPENLFLCREQGRTRVHLIDYGYARPWRRNSPIAPVSIATTDFVGTQRYAAPEQADPRTAADVDHRADLYALGLVLYTLITGERPYADLEPRDALLAARQGQPLARPPRAVLDRIPPELWRVLHTALAKHPGDRFQTADDFARALAEVAGDLGYALAGGARDTASRTKRPRHPDD